MEGNTCSLLNASVFVYVKKKNLYFNLRKVKYNIDTEYPSAGPNKSLQTRFPSQRSKFQEQRSKRQKECTMHRSDIRLMCSENKKQLLFMVSEKWSGQNCHEKCYNIKGNSQTVKLTLQCTGSMYS